MSARMRPQIAALIVRYSDGSETSIETDQQTLDWTLDIEREMFEMEPFGGYRNVRAGDRMKLRLVVTGWAVQATHTAAPNPVAATPNLPAMKPLLGDGS